MADEEILGVVPSETSQWGFLMSVSVVVNTKICLSKYFWYWKCIIPVQIISFLTRQIQNSMEQVSKQISKEEKYGSTTLSIFYLNCIHVLVTINFQTFKKQNCINSQYKKWKSAY